MNQYYRVCSPSQTDEDIEKQLKSKEVWGKPPRNYNQSDIPKVKAYSKRPQGRNIRGIKFWTDIPPDPGGIPGQPTWSGGREGVRIEDGYAKMKVIKISLFTIND
ncbi:hypothetical protein IQ255_11960 [Pleurocapsales cyanobacterium LEGE 10410]|nr:hypothetical protein [Pleurocapsales cyanobacterium LEGE 10410]